MPEMQMRSLGLDDDEASTPAPAPGSPVKKATQPMPPGLSPKKQPAPPLPSSLPAPPPAPPAGFQQQQQHPGPSGATPSPPPPPPGPWNNNGIQHHQHHQHQQHHYPPPPPHGFMHGPPPPRGMPYPPPPPFVGGPQFPRGAPMPPPRPNFKMMAPRDINFVVQQQQMKQIRSSDPFSDDYYFHNYVQKRTRAGANGLGPRPPALPLPSRKLQHIKSVDPRDAQREAGSRNWETSYQVLGRISIPVVQKGEVRFKLVTTES